MRGFNNTIISLEEKTPCDYLKIVSGNVRARRLDKNLTQAELANRAGVKLPTYRKFEQTGDISLASLLRIAWALDMLDDFDEVFARKQYASIDEVLSENKTPRKRAGKHGKR